MKAKRIRYKFSPVAGSPALNAESYAVGDYVIATQGPHKGTIHQVVYVFPNGKQMNLVPRVPASHNRYRLGACSATFDQVRKPCPCVITCSLSSNDQKERYLPNV